MHLQCQLRELRHVVVTPDLQQSSSSSSSSSSSNAGATQTWPACLIELGEYLIQLGGCAGAAAWRARTVRVHQGTRCLTAKFAWH